MQETRLILHNICIILDTRHPSTITQPRPGAEYSTLSTKDAMPTEAQIRANRENVKKPTGPKTKSGQARSCLNALRHGYTSQHPVSKLPPRVGPVVPSRVSKIPPAGTRHPSLQTRLVHGFSPTQIILDPFENELFEIFAENLTKEFNPATQHELFLVDRIIDCAWRIRRAGRLESEKLRSYLDTPGKTLGERLFEDDQQRRLFALSSHETRIERSMYRAIHELRKMQERREQRCAHNEHQEAPKQDIPWLPYTAPDPEPTQTLIKTHWEAAQAARKSIEELEALKDQLESLVDTREGVLETLETYQLLPHLYSDQQRTQARHALAVIEAKLGSYLGALTQYQDNKFKATNPIPAIHEFVRSKLEEMRSALDAFFNPRPASELPPDVGVEESPEEERDEEIVGERGEAAGAPPAHEVHPLAAERSTLNTQDTQAIPDSSPVTRHSSRPSQATTPKTGDTRAIPDPSPVTCHSSGLSPKAQAALEELRRLQIELHEAEQMTAPGNERTNRIYRWKKEIDRHLYLNGHWIPPDLIPYNPNAPNPEDTS